MNEQIKELAEQAGGGPSKWYTNPNVLEKFAELLLKASFDVVINDGRFHDARGIIKAGKYTAMEHFGVEK